ncbi:MAG: caspase family protein [Raineya sp.]|jgi:hypothetical protein|nr:caspase family protein [Raineya sp.]
MNHLVLIAIDNYPNYKKLKNAKFDAEKIGEVLESYYDFRIFKELYDINATRENIINEINELHSAFDKNDNLIIFFAGHGHQNNKTKKGYWLPYDAKPDSEASYVSNIEIKSAIESISAKHIFLIVDACFAGTFLTQTRGDISSLANIKAEKWKSRWYLSSGREEEVNDGFENEHSPFAKELISYLENNQNKEFHISQLISGVTKKVNDTCTQQAISGIISDTGHEAGGEMVFRDNRTIKITHNREDEAWIKSIENKHIIEQLYESLKRFEDILVLPRNFLMNLYPFNKSRDEFSHLGNYSLHTKNQELLDFFDKITVNGDKIEYSVPEYLNSVKNHAEKLKLIFKQLNHAQILYVWLGNEYKNIRLNNNIACDCILCSYQNFNFLKAAQLLKEYNIGDEKKAIDNAFAHYLFGNYFTSAQCYIDLEAKFKKDEKNILRLICVHNLVKLSKYDTEIEWLISDGLIDRIEGEEAIKKLRNIDEWKVIGDTSTNRKEKELLEWIKEENTFYYGFTKITNLSKKLIDNYHRIKNGGTVRSQEIDDLKVKLNELILFYVGNGLIFQHFKEFYDIVALATEAFIASHCIPKDKDSSKLKHFDDTLLSNIVLYCHAEDLDKCFDKYQVKEISYQSNSYMFWDRVNNFFDSKNNLSLILPLLKERTNRKFLGTYKNICKNLLLVVGYMKVETESFEMILEKILRFWKETPIIIKDREMQRFLTEFFFLKEENLKNEKLSEVLFDFLKFLIVYKDFKDEHLEIVRLLVRRFEKYDKQYQIDNKDIIEKILVNSQNERELLVYIYPVIAENFKNLMIEKLQSSLFEKFDIYLFYEAMYAGMLDYKEYFDKIIEGKHYEAAISIGYKYKLDFQDTLFQEIKTQSPYFEWLIKPESFDYSLFQIKWIHEIEYTSLREIIWKSQKLKEYLEKYLKENDNENLRKFYFKYCI